MGTWPGASEVHKDESISDLMFGENACYLWVVICPWSHGWWSSGLTSRIAHKSTYEMVLKPGAVGGCPGRRSWNDLRMATGEAVWEWKQTNCVKGHIFNVPFNVKVYFLCNFSNAFIRISTSTKRHSGLCNQRQFSGCNIFPTTCRLKSTKYENTRCYSGCFRV